MIVCTLIFMKASLSNNSSSSILLGITLMIISSILVLYFSDGRRDFVRLILFFILLWSIYIKEIKGVYVIAGVIFGIFALLSITISRSGNEINLFYLLKDISQNKEVLIRLLTMNLDIMVAYDNFQFIIIELHENLLYGSSFFKLITFWIPRYIWADKPMGVQSLIIDLYDNQFAGGSSQSTGIIGEIFWNFGFVGTLIVMIILGFLLRKMSLYMKYNKFNYWIMIFLIALVSWLPEFFRGGISTTVLTNYIQYFIVINFYFFCYNSIKKSNLNIK